MHTGAGWEGRQCPVVSSRPLWAHPQKRFRTSCVPLDVCISLHAQPMRNRHCVARRFHFFPFGLHAESLVQMRMKHFDARFMEAPDDFLALLASEVLPRVKTLSSTADNEHIRFIGTAGIEQPPPRPIPRRSGGVQTSTRRALRKA